MLKTIILLTDTVQQQQPLANLLREHHRELARVGAFRQYLRMARVMQPRGAKPFLVQRGGHDRVACPQQQGRTQRGEPCRRARGG